MFPAIKSFTSNALLDFTLHLSDEDIILTGNYEYYKEQLLADNRFIECFRNTIVNMNYIESAQQDFFLLKTGARIPISRRRKNNVMKQYTNFLIESRWV